ncbi:hypothetical protein PsorP6_001774 [Peronosclerospora sorghi]|uniref:Uncharacterized protein n=1 Tax=Peronosclerospora sorghi TaxID=230839 RepID=A0ACC0WQZ2_9STRA|nr:hypothetical protein PsorP6_001774 [Peronosclerospora sorghi]
MLEIQREEEQQRESFQAKIAQLETRYHRHELLRDGILSAIRRMQTWLSSSVYQQASQDTREVIDLKVTSAKEKIDLIKVERCQKEWKAKHEQLVLLRDSVNRAMNDNALNVLTRQTEIKVRCNNYNLESILEYLTEEERKVAAKRAISSVSHFFTKDELRSSQSREILARIQEQLQLASDKESLETSLDKELRKRAQLFQHILNGLTEYRHDEMTEHEFMEKNEQNLKYCEEIISRICDALRAKQSQRTSIAEILASIESLDTAKDVIRRLIVELYS